MSVGNEFSWFSHRVSFYFPTLSNIYPSSR
ncbi:hypothetical protein GYA27_02585 [candidate division WWE3 bacterium]|uniref:Uncharacterized protein n=1 Tax=candidate division WWE3 bacterium TaxID=2053526 RepID=A0A7X9DKE2_UNCKA|nr:hypothetical protein [candidate division WWE3 bacterium]